MIAVQILVKDDDAATSINIILLLLLLIVALLFKNVLQGYKNLAQVARVVLNQDKPIKYKTSIVKNKTYLIENNYKLSKDNELYSIYYKYISYTGYKVLKIRKLKTIIIIKNEKIDYYNKQLHEDIETLEDKQIKEAKFNRHLILAFKEFNQISNHDIKSIGEVVSYGIGKQFFTQINIGLSKKDQKAFFLYSNKYNPTVDYKELVDDIKTIIS